MAKRTKTLGVVVDTSQAFPSSRWDSVNPATIVQSADWAYLAPFGNGQDDQPNFTTIFSASASAKELLLMAGAVSVKTPSASIPSGLFVESSPGSSIASSLANTGIFNDVFVGNRTLTNNIGSLHTNTVYASRTMVVDMPTKPMVGNALEVAFHTNAIVYDVVAVTGVGPFTVTVDRPIVWPWQADVTNITEVSSYSSDVRFDFNGLVIVGIAVAGFEIADGLRWVIKDLSVRPDTQGNVMSVASIVFDIGCRECYAEGCDYQNILTGRSYGFYYQSNERSLMRRMVVRETGAAAFVNYDSYQTGFEDCWAYDCGEGAHLGRFDANGFGCIDCWLMGGGIVGASTTGGWTGHGAVVDATTRTTIARWTSDTCDGIGFYVTGSAKDTCITANSTAKNCSSGITVDPGCKGTKVSNVHIENCTTTAILAQDDLTITNSTIDNGIASATNIVNVTAGNFIAQGLTINNAKVAAVALGIQAGVSAMVSDMFVSTAGANVIGVYVTGGVARLSNVRVQGQAGMYGLWVKAGATCYVDDLCDFSSCGTPITLEAGGKLIGNFAGNGSPLGVIPASIGSTYQRLDGGAGTSFYVKEANNDATGWVAK